MKSFRLILGSALLVFGIPLVIFFRVSISEKLFSLSVGFRGITDPSYSYGEFLSIRRENEGLKAELDRLKKDIGTILNGNSINAHVYSRFPTNTRSLITADRGSEAGVREGMSVFADINQTIFVGRVLHTTRFQSEIQTIFDPVWKSSVAIGDKKIKAMLVGGNSPYIDLIPKDAAVDAKERVINVSPEYPLGAFLGTIGKIETNTNEIWQKAQLNPSMFPDTLDHVYITTEFP